MYTTVLFATDGVVNLAASKRPGCLVGHTVSVVISGLNDEQEGNSQLTGGRMLKTFLEDCEKQFYGGAIYYLFDIQIPGAPIHL